MRKDPISWFRRSTGIALITLLVGVSLEPLLHTDVGHDSDCSPAIVLHDAQQHVIGAAPSTEDASHGTDHCVVCHLFRYSRDVDSQRSVIELRVSLIVRPDDSAGIRSVSALPLPARAPPADFSA